MQNDKKTGIKYAGFEDGKIYFSSLQYLVERIKNNKNMENKKNKTLINFKKASSLLSKIIQMIEDNQYCVNIMQQNLAAIGLLRSAHEMLMENHLNTCFKKAMSTRNEKRKRQMTEEILSVTKLFNK